MKNFLKKPLFLIEIITLSKTLASDEFVLANLNAAGFYQTNYDNYYWNLIIKQLKTNKDVSIGVSQANL